MRSRLEKERTWPVMEEERIARLAAIRRDMINVAWGRKVEWNEPWKWKLSKCVDKYELRRFFSFLCEKGKSWSWRGRSRIFFLLFIGYKINPDHKYKNGTWTYPDCGSVLKAAGLYERKRRDTIMEYTLNREIYRRRKELEQGKKCTNHMKLNYRSGIVFEGAESIHHHQ